MRFKILKVRQTTSGERRPSGAISRKHAQTPNAQNILMSLEDFLLITLMIRGIFQRGKIIAAINAIFCMPIS
jgi:hypothetical protein